MTFIVESSEQIIQQSLGNRQSGGDEGEQCFVQVDNPTYKMYNCDMEKNELSFGYPVEHIGTAMLINADCFEWLDKIPDECIHGVVTDPPFSLREFSDENIIALDKSKGNAIWQTHRYADGCHRNVQPCFSTLSKKQRNEIYRFFLVFSQKISRVMLPGAHAIIAAHPSLAHRVFCSIEDGGLEFNGSIIRHTSTMRGGGRPQPDKEHKFRDVSISTRSAHEPWGLFQKPMPKGMSVLQCLNKYNTGGLRRQVTKCGESSRPLFDVIEHTERATENEKSLSKNHFSNACGKHPNLKPQSLMSVLAGKRPFLQKRRHNPAAVDRSRLYLWCRRLQVPFFLAHGKSCLFRKHSQF